MVELPVGPSWKKTLDIQYMWNKNHDQKRFGNPQDKSTYENMISFALFYVNDVTGLMPGMVH